MNMISQFSHKIISYLLQLVSDKEIEQGLFSIPSDNVTSPDGMPAKFYQKAWQILKLDFLAMAHSFFHRGYVLKEMN